MSVSPLQRQTSSLKMMHMGRIGRSVQDLVLRWTSISCRQAVQDPLSMTSLHGKVGVDLRRHDGGGSAKVLQS